MKLAHVLEYIPLRVSVALIDIVPTSVALSLARALGRGAWLALPKRRKLAVANVLLAGITEDPKDARRIAKASFESFSMLTVESLIAMKMFAKDADQNIVEFDIPEDTWKLIRDPSASAIYLSAHLGNWEVGGNAISFTKTMAAVARKMNNPLVDRFLQRRNPRVKMEVIPKHSKDRLALLRPLRHGKLLALLCDQHAPTGVMVPFFGHPAKTYDSPARLHLATGTPILFGYCVRTGPMKFKYVSTSPLVFETTGDRDTDALAITARLNGYIEEAVRKYPEQYLWAHRRWRS